MTAKRSWMIGLVVAAATVPGTLATTAPADAADRVYVRVGDLGWTNQFLYRPKKVHTGSTGGAKNLRWRNWGKRVATAKGQSYSSNSGVAPKDRNAPAVIRMRGRTRCYGRMLYTVVDVRAFGMKYTQKLGCDIGLHIGSKS